jgi:hypothetical protein
MLVDAGSREAVLIVQQAGSVPRVVSTVDSGLTAVEPSSSSIGRGTEYRWKRPCYPGSPRHSSESKRVNADGRTKSSTSYPSSRVTKRDGDDVDACPARDHVRARFLRPMRNHDGCSQWDGTKTRDGNRTAVVQS